MKEPLSAGLQLLQMMMQLKYRPATIECAKGLFLLSEDRRALALELINFIEAGNSEQEFWNLLQQNYKQLD